MLVITVLAVLLNGLLATPVAFAAPTSYVGSQTHNIAALDLRNTGDATNRGLSLDSETNAQAVMSKHVETACREKGGTPQLEDGEPVCNMNPKPSRKTPAVRKGYRHNNLQVTMSLEQEERCRATGGTPELRNGGASCNMNPVPKRRTPKVVSWPANPAMDRMHEV